MPEDIPSNPDIIYQGRGWQGWRDFLGTKPFLTLDEAKALLRQKGIASRAEYLALRKQNAEYQRLLPTKPHDYYKDKGWRSWPDFHGGEPVNDPTKTFLSYTDACALVRQHNIISSTDYKERFKELGELPSSPERVYDKEWTSWPEFLGVRTRSGPRKKQFLPYE